MKKKSSNTEEKEKANKGIMLLLLLLLLLQSCLTLCDPVDGSPPGSPGFSRQEHWSGLPFPSPVHESEK